MRVLAILAMALLCSGCFVLDEFDQGEELMRQASSRGGKNLEDEKREAARNAQWDQKPGASKRDGDTLGDVQKTLSGWWDKATAEPVPEPGPGDKLVRCKLGSSSSFMRLRDCEVRGGSPA